MLYSQRRGRGGPPMRMRGGRGRFIRGVAAHPQQAPIPGATKKVAIGRNIFPGSDEEDEDGGTAGTGSGDVPAHVPAGLPMALRGRGRGRFIRIGRGALPGLKLKKLVHGEATDDAPFPKHSDDRPGLGYKGPTQGGGNYKSRGNSRWSRWQQLSRNKDGDNNGRDDAAETSPVTSDDEYGESAHSSQEPGKKDRHDSRSASKNSMHRRTASPIDADPSKGIKALVLTYESEETGILSGPNETKILFHVNQVWIKHPSAGYCQFAEIYSTADLSKHFYPGRQVNVLMRVIPKTRDVKGQAEAMWLQGHPPEEELFRTRELGAELNFHLAQYQSGKHGKLEMVLSVDKHSSMDGTVHEYVSYEAGVIRLVGKDNGVVLFHLDQVWIVDNGNWILYKDIMKKPLQYEYLPIGSLVSLSVRKIPCSANSQLRYQAMVVWNKDVCKYREAQVGEAGSWQQLRNPGLADGQVPPGYKEMYGNPENHAKLIKSLDCHFNNFKNIAKLPLKNISGVPVLLNMLPSSWEASVYKVVDDENGVIVIKHRRGSNMSGDNKLKINKMFAIFHIDDVFTSSGEKFRRSPNEFMLQLHNQEVDLTARSIVGEGAFEGVFTAASQLNLSIMNPNVACPVLQGITVFLKDGPDSEANTRLAPKPTVLRSYPESFHHDDPGTAFFLNSTLLCRLDLKALNFFNATNQARMQKDIINGIPMAYFHQTKKSISTDKQEQIKLMAEVEKLDRNESVKLLYGFYKELPRPPIVYPQAMNNVSCNVGILYQQGLFAKEGVLRCEIPAPGGFKIYVYAYFDISNFKFLLTRELRPKDFAEIIPVCSGIELRANIILINQNNPIPYVAPAVWNPSLWNRAPDHAPKLDDIYLQKYERSTAAIVGGNLAPVPTLSVPPPTMFNPAIQPGNTNIPPPGIGPPPTAATILSRPPPQIINAAPPQQPKMLWSRKELLREAVGRVTSIIDDNYGLAVVKFASSTPPHDRYRAIVLFDTCDLWLGEHTATELNTSLTECMREGDFIKVKALLVPESENTKNIRYLATGVVTGRTKQEVRGLPLPEQEKLEHIDRIHPDKLNNFYQVVSVVCANLPGDAEDEVKGVSTDEESLPKQARWQQPPSGNSFGVSKTDNYHQHLPGGPGSIDNHQDPAVQDYAREISDYRQFSRSSLVSRDKFEEELEAKRAAKLHECSSSRRRVAYDKGLRDKLLSEMKLQNQLLWKCRDCEISCAKPGMEKHIQLKTHWDKVLENYNKKLEGLSQNSVI